MRFLSQFGVAAFGLVTSIATAVVVTAIYNFTEFDLFQFNIWIIFPMGAVLVGIAAASGYYFGSLHFDKTATRLLRWQITIITAAAYCLIYYAKYSILFYGDQRLSDVLPFNQYVDIAITTRHYSTTRGGDDGEAGQFFGYVLALLQFIGFAAAGACFCYLLPAAEAPAPSTQTAGPAQPTRSRPRGIAMLLCAALLTVWSVYWAYHVYDIWDLQKSDILLVGFSLLGAAGAYTLGQKLLMPDARTVLARDSRNPVVYLRPFDEDSRRVHGLPVGERHGGRQLEFYGSAPASWEVRIAGPLQGIGPFVSVGAPGDTLAPLGSARMYLADDEWQAQVESLVRSAAAIVLQPDTTEGTRWEIGKVAQWVDPRRLLVLVPNPALRPLGYARIQALTAETFKTPLPKDLEKVDAFMFDETGQPTPIILGRKVAEALSPFLDQVRALSPQPKVMA
jgi:hypothetical protein